MNNFFGTILILALAVSLMFMVNYRTEAQISKTALTHATLRNDSLMNANMAYDTILSSILNDTNKITLNLDLLVKSNPEVKQYVSPKKKKGWFKRIFGK